MRYEPKTVIKAQALADFLIEMVNEEEAVDLKWMLYIDGGFNSKGSGASVILDKARDIVIELSLKFDFPISNNQAEYEALIAGLQLASDVGATQFMIYSDSHIVTTQVNGAYQAKDMMLHKYLAKVKDLMRKFSFYKVQHIPREENVKADILSKLASTKPGGTIRL